MMPDLPCAIPSRMGGEQKSIMTTTITTVGTKEPVELGTLAVVGTRSGVIGTTPAVGI